MKALIQTETDYVEVEHLVVVRLNNLKAIHQCWYALLLLSLLLWQRNFSDSVFMKYSRTHTHRQKVVESGSRMRVYFPVHPQDVIVYAEKIRKSVWASKIWPIWTHSSWRFPNYSDVAAQATGPRDTLQWASQLTGCANLSSYITTTQD